jgi:hypothetical protein
MVALNWGDLVKDAGESASGSYEPLPDGDYDLKVIEASSTTTSTGKTMFKITCEVQGGAFAKRRIWDNLVISPENKNALGIFFSKMAALGVSREWFAQSNPSNAQIETSINGKFFRAQVGSRIWQNEKRNEIKKYYVVSSPAVTASAPAEGSVPPAPPAPPVAPPAPPAPPVAPVASAPVAPTESPF